MLLRNHEIRDHEIMLEIIHTKIISDTNNPKLIITEHHTVASFYNDSFQVSESVKYKENTKKCAINTLYTLFIQNMRLCCYFRFIFFSLFRDLSNYFSAQ